MSLQENFNTQKYESALNLANSYLEINSEHYDVLWARGVANLELGNYELAIADFELLDRSDQRELYDKAKWYLAMTYLKKRDIEKCKEYLELIIKENAYSPKGVNLRRLIDSLLTK